MNLVISLKSNKMKSLILIVISYILTFYISFCIFSVNNALFSEILFTPKLSYTQCFILVFLISAIFQFNRSYFKNDEAEHEQLIQLIIYKFIYFTIFLFLGNFYAIIIL